MVRVNLIYDAMGIHSCKNFVKVTVLLNELLKVDLTKFFMFTHSTAVVYFVEITEIYSNLTFFGKNVVKITRELI